FTRDTGNPSNIPLNAANTTASPITMGTATWPTGTAPDSNHQTIVLHINDAAECDALYGGNPGTCFVLPGGETPLPPTFPANTVACKSVIIDEACTADPLTVPAFTKLHIHYAYTIVNTLANGCSMVFDVPGPKTQDINSGGGKDYFGCEQQPDPNSNTPGAA